ncbi:hypothetical protein ACFOQM_04460 [Paenibacillus sp. GCM10012307]|uniref:Glycosyl hydrolase family 32 N-terminal domain-containing protein n=1 Tax=Paenibacillus roseus TaxID=2798579 RepID=A0A934MP60_9BACL|nr:hypothetical protein [Paenibacillus roseus]MBJ6360563.1 hypothetical protein [Paenibacillus roseus]
MGFSTQILSKGGVDFFAPFVFYYKGKKRMFVTTGPVSQKKYVDRLWGLEDEVAKYEKWYVSGANTIQLYEEITKGNWRKLSFGFPDINQFDEMMGCSFLEQNHKMYLFFSGKIGNMWSLYIIEGIDGETWGSSREVLKPSLHTDQEHVFLPSVLMVNGQFHMWYVGRNYNNRRIHYAVSSDLYCWDKKGVVFDLGNQGDPDDYATDCPSVKYVNELFVMAYGGGLMRGIMLASSQDGLKWNRVKPEIFRGPSTSKDHLYAFYPSLYLDEQDSFRIIYAGENRDNEWSIFERKETYDMHNLMKVEPYEVNIEWYEKALHIISKVPPKYMGEPDDCHQDIEKYNNKLEGIQQIRPSSSPLFLVEYNKTPIKEVFKLGRSREKLEVEYEFRNRFSRVLPVIPAAIKYISQTPIMIMPYVENAVELAKYATIHPERFMNILEDLLDRFVTITRQTMIPYDIELINFTGQTPQLMIQWLRKLLIQGLNPLFLNPIIVNGKRLGCSIYEELSRCDKVIETTPEWISMFTGDNHFRNFLVTEAEDYYALDFEFSGYIDLDYTVAKFIGSAIKHLNVTQNESIAVNQNGTFVDYEFMDDVHRSMLSTSWFFDKLQSLPINYSRVYALLFSKLYFRLDQVWQRSSEERAKNVAMAVVAIQLFRNQDDGHV